MDRSDLKLVPLVQARALAERSDEELMVAAAADARAAFAILVERHLPKVINYCAKATGDRRAAEDLAQDVFLGVWARREQFRPERAFRVFLFTVACNRCRNHARSWRRRFRWLGVDASEDLPKAASADPSHIDELIVHERQRRVRGAVTELPVKLREAVLLRFEQDLSYAEIATIVRSNEATVRSRVFHGLRRLEMLLEQEVP
ncbi:MAG: polymerase sigma-54 factor RpoN [Myxococcales bacterium]|nr:polymerase sigma-54 factor RpoN [Myxococcales bacterium]